MNKFYKKKSISKGEPWQLPSFQIKTISLHEEMVEIEFAGGHRTWVGFNFPPLGLGVNGAHGYMYPEHLPFDHVGFVISRDSFNQVQHRSSGEKLQLKFDRNFMINGEYALIPKAGDPMYYTSALWSKQPKALKEYIQSLNNTKFKDIKGTIYAILNSETGQTHNALLLSRISTEKKKYCVFMLFEESVIYGFPLNLLVDE